MLKKGTAFVGRRDEVKQNAKKKHLPPNMTMYSLGPTRGHAGLVLSQHY
ncbi:hypothetical protein SNOG_09264 [Parastagonospora nodorum SN15]|uniref:Uncharacterized protein n=1 Tax=Phaeosphaeria nodorum (strain SN15 / ATCC MYA-4574 / FGSC 10173) TaxID=321614 RepID=Q0UG50_PHANO|nr:hypothetical protein SNOG_09264 [Parastagonospora nodorum SN15]EAT83456.1 hypothetical protein SNOG_09264 [Parastagonospora nodorum SN15]